MPDHSPRPPEVDPSDGGSNSAGNRSRDRRARVEPDLGWVLAVLALPTALVGLACLLPLAFVLPAFSLLSLPLGFGVAACAWLAGARRRQNHSDLGLQVGGLLVFMGIVAALAVDSDAFLHALGTPVTALLETGTQLR